MGRAELNTLLLTISSFILAGSVWTDFAIATGLEQFVKEEIVPDIIDTTPKGVIDIKYGNLEVKFGNKVSPSEAVNPPTTITWDADPNKFYLLIMSDPDAQDRAKHAFRGKGLHRYVFLVFEQPGKLAFDEKFISPQAGFRGKFSTRKLAKKYNLGEPISGNFFQAENDGKKLSRQFEEMQARMEQEVEQDA